MSTLKERQQLLLDDLDISAIEPHRVYCNRCRKWLKLDETKLFAASVWRCHKATKSHNSRPLNLTAPAPHLVLDDGKRLKPSKYRRSSLAALIASQSTGSITSSSPRDTNVNTNVANGSLSRADGTSSASSSTTAKPFLWLRRTSPPAPSGVGDPSVIASSTKSVLGQVSKKEASSVLRGVNTQITDVLQPAQSNPQVSHTSMPPPSSLLPLPSAPPPPTLTEVSPKEATAPLAASSKASIQPRDPPIVSSISNPVRRVQSTPVSGRNRDPKASRSIVYSLERLSPHRKASYKALVAEPYIGKLEPFRAFCKLCDRWVGLSSRTPYSYGVWKGHIRKTEKHNRLHSCNAEDDFDTASDHSHEDIGAPSGPAGDKSSITKEPAVLAPLATPSLSNMGTDVGLSQGKINGSNAYDSHSLPSKVPAPAASQNMIAPMLSPDVSSPSPVANPFTLKATTLDSFGPRNTLPSVPFLESKVSQTSLTEWDGMPMLTDSTEGDNKRESVADQASPSKGPPPHVIQQRRELLESDPDIAVVESRRVKCGLCDRWIKGSTSQEYSAHHWLKHKRKCTRLRTDVTDRSSEPVDARKASLETDPTVNILEPHRALCGICNKWVKLCSRSQYSASHWVQHKRKCFSQSKSETAQQEIVEPPTSSGNEKRNNHKIPPPPTTVESRRAILVADPDILQLFPERVQCRPCGRWIKLSLPVEYSPSHWLTHKESCPGQTLDSPTRLSVALEARKRTLEKDPNAAVVEPHRIRCSVCNTWVKLRQDCSYSLGKWVAHQRRCRPIAWPSQTEIQKSLEANEADNESEDPNDDQEAMDVEHVLKGEGDHTNEGDVPQDKVLIEASPTDDGESVRKVAQVSSPCASREDGDVEVAVKQCDPPSCGESAKDVGQHIEPEIQEGVDLRRSRFLEDPDALQLEPRSVTCRQCQARVALEGPDSYMFDSWLAHKNCCKQQIADVDSVQSRKIPAGEPTRALIVKSTETARANTSIDRPIRPLPKGKGKGTNFRRAPSPMTLPPLPSRPRWPSEDERKQQFVDDPDVEKIEPHRLLCKLCSCWIRLHPIIRYAQSVWPRHKASCKYVQLMFPGDAKIRARSEKEDIRKHVLDDDDYTTEVGPHRVTCKACGSTIRLDTTYKYEGSHWRAHRARCPMIPFQERISKKRRTTENHGREDLQHPVGTPGLFKDHITTDSSDSDDSDASSAARPRPTSFFTAPLVINPTQMFKRRPRVVRHSATAASIAAAKARKEAENATHLQMIAAELVASGRFTTVLDSTGEGVMSVDTLLMNGQRCMQQHSDHDTLEDVEAPPTPRSSSSPNPESWVPRKRTQEEEEEFNAFFSRRPAPCIPLPADGEVRVCKLGKDDMEIVD